MGGEYLLKFLGLRPTLVISGIGDTPPIPRLSLIACLGQKRLSSGLVTSGCLCLLRTPTSTPSPPSLRRPWRRLWPKLESNEVLEILGGLLQSCNLVFLGLRGPGWLYGRCN